MSSDKVGFIPEEDYKKILSLVPVPCVDIVVVYNNEFLLGRRVNEPAKGEWMVAGGRVFKGELLAETAVRKVREEFGIEAEADQFQFLANRETILNESAFEGIPAHTVNSIFLLKLDEEPDVNIENSDFSEFGWFEKIDKSWHPYLKFCLEKAGFK